MGQSQNKFISQDHAFAGMEYIRGKIFEREKKYSKADFAFKNSLESFKASEECVIKRIKLLEEKENYSMAKSLQKQFDEEYADCLYRTGINLQKMSPSENEKALSYFKQAKDKHPSTTTIYLFMINENNLKTQDEIIEFLGTFQSKDKDEINLRGLCIKDVEMEFYIVPEIINKSSYFQNIQTVNLSWNKIGDKGADALSKSFKKLPYLETVILSGNLISTEGMKSLSVPMRKIISIWIDSNNLNSKSAPHIASLLKNNKIIEVIHMYQNEIGEGMSEVVSASLTAPNLRVNLLQSTNMVISQGSQLLSNNSKKLQTLSFGGNNSDISEEGDFYQGIIENTNLKRLYLYKNKIGKGESKLASALKENISLEFLDITETGLSPQGILKIAFSLKENPKSKLSTLKIANNKIGNSFSGIQAIKILLSNEKIKDLDISNCNLGDEGITEIIKELKNSNLIRIKMNNNSITNSIGNHLLEIQDILLIADDNLIDDSTILDHFKVLKEKMKIKIMIQLMDNE